MGVTGSNPCTTGVCTCPPRPRPPPLLSARQPSIVILRLAPLSLCAAVGAGGQRAMSLVWFRGEWGHCCSDTASRPRGDGGSTCAALRVCTAAQAELASTHA
jgi:hypothetical protein